MANEQKMALIDKTPNGQGQATRRPWAWRVSQAVQPSLSLGNSFGAKQWPPILAPTS
jgi:hypothetical protein